ncbi:MAG: acyltransferase family protein, partial [Candidatus Eremiobacteraeota bacterium]|nr:acyltransferase family protein [Candidatus Eremiobacteraeota bacterium]
PYSARMSDRASRQYELDWLRLLAVASVMGLHLAETYARPTDDPTAALTVQSPTLGHLIVLTSYWRMPILFCIAGMVAMHTRGRRTLRAYVLTRAERLLLPLVLGLAVLNPIQLALEGYLTGTVGVHSAWAYLWFLGALAFITVGTIPVGAWLARPTVQRRLARGAGRVPRLSSGTSTSRPSLAIAETSSREWCSPAPRRSVRRYRPNAGTRSSPGPSQPSCRPRPRGSE